LKLKNLIIPIIFFTIISPKTFAGEFQPSVQADVSNGTSVQDDKELKDKELLQGLEEFAQNSPMNFYQAPEAGPSTKTSNERKQEYTVPMFKKYRIKITNFIREKEYNHEQKLLQKQALKDKEKADFEADEELEQPQEVTENNDKKSDKTIKLKGGVKQQITSTDVQLDADNVDFDGKTMDITATGTPVLYFPPQDTTIFAKKMVYNHASNILKAYENVRIIKDGNEILGDYLEINMNEENAFMDNVDTKSDFIKVTARNGYMDDKAVTLFNGKLESEGSYILDLKSDMIPGTSFEGMMIPEKDRSSIEDIVGPDKTLDIKTKELIIDGKKNTNTITFKKAQVNYGGVDLFKIRSFTAHTNKNNEYFEANYPEFGSKSRIGTFIGPGFTFDTPLQDGSTVKVIPVLNMRSMSNFGVGALAKYKSGTNFSDIGYSTTYNTIVLRGRQKLDDKLYLQYGAHSYLDEWFFGQRMAKYAVEGIYADNKTIPSTIGKDKNFMFSHRFGVGFMRDNDFNRSDENYTSTSMSTLRMRYMAQGVQNLYNYANVDNQTALNLNLVMQGSAAVYGSGDTQMVGRIGPQINTQYKRWIQSITYFATTYDDNTPMEMYDAFRFGHSSLHIREGLRLNKYLSIAWAGTVNLTNDAPNREIFQENAFILAIGPDDFKIHIGYDWFRQETFVSCIMSLNTKGSTIHYDKMIIKNPDRLAQNDKEKVELKVFGPAAETNNTAQKGKPAKMMYAQVIDIEDPNREQL